MGYEKKWRSALKSSICETEQDSTKDIEDQ